MRSKGFFSLVTFLWVLTTVVAPEPLRLLTDLDVQGHRGARGLKPENTLPAFETALDLQVTTLELDLHFTLDAVVVVWHDDRIGSDKCGLDPTAPDGVPDPDSLISQVPRLSISALTWEQLQAYRCDRNPEPLRFPDQNNAATQLAGDDFHIPNLEEVFAFVETYAQSAEKNEAQRAAAAGIRFNVETKRKPNDAGAIGDDFNGEKVGAFELAILDLIARYGLQDRIVIQSFEHRSLWAVHAENNHIRLAALTTRIQPDLANLAARGALIWSPDARDLTPTLLQAAHGLGMQVIPWTVNEVGAMRRLIAMGVDGIITDRPDVLLALAEDGKG